MHPLHQRVIALHFHCKEPQRRRLRLSVRIRIGIDGLSILIRGFCVGRTVLVRIDVAIRRGDIQKALGGIHGDVLHLPRLRHGDKVAVFDIDAGSLLSGGAHVAVGAVEDHRQRQRPRHQLCRSGKIAVASAAVFVIFIVLIHEELLSSMYHTTV